MEYIYSFFFIRSHSIKQISLKNKNKLRKVLRLKFEDKETKLK